MSLWSAAVESELYCEPGKHHIAYKTPQHPCERVLDLSSCTNLPSRCYLALIVLASRFQLALDVEKGERTDENKLE